jgi:MFS transporter, FSR family, fosmidomycin resistance protein
MMSTADQRSASLSLTFSYLGHAVMHILAALYLTVVLQLERSWSLGYDELIKLWTLGSLLIGLGAPLAGWLGDRWSDARMMVLMFLITGAGSVLAGYAETPLMLTAALAVLGLGASIYHPVGISWLVKNAANQGRAMGVMGIFGAVGIASAALIAGGLSQAWNWQAAFILPGIVSILLGLMLAALILTGIVRDRQIDLQPRVMPARGEAVRAFFVLSVTMVCAGLIFNGTQTVVPKWFDSSLGTLVGGSTLGIGGLVTLVYLFASSAQFLGGWLSDRFDIKRVYVGCLLVQVPVLFLAAAVGGPLVLALAMTMVFAGGLQVPAENLLLARYTPAKYRGLAYGAKFILSFGAAPVAIQIVAWSFERTTDFSLLFNLFGILALTAWLAAFLLPASERALKTDAAKTVAAE